MKFVCLTCDRQKFSDGKDMFKIIGTITGESVENGSQVITFYSQSSAVPNQDYEFTLVGSSDMKSLKIRLGQPIFAKK